MGVRINCFVGLNISQALQKRERFSTDQAQNRTFTLLLNPIFCNICSVLEECRLSCFTVEKYKNEVLKNNWKQIWDQLKSRQREKREKRESPGQKSRIEKDRSTAEAVWDPEEIGTGREMWVMAQTGANHFWKQRRGIWKFASKCMRNKESEMSRQRCNTVVFLCTQFGKVWSKKAAKVRLYCRHGDW